MAVSANDLASAFPEVSAGEWPVGPRILVQFHTIREQTSGGIVLVNDTRDLNKSLTQVAKVLALGQIAFCNRESGQRWPEGVWCKVGDLVSVPKYIGRRFSRPIPGTNDRADFAIIEDHQVTSIVDPAQFETIAEIM